MPNLSSNIFLYMVGFVFVIIFYSILQYIRSVIQARHERKNFIWQQEELVRIEKRRAIEQEAKKYNNSKVTLNNPFMINITNTSRIILFGGEPGAGKSLTMNLFAKWLHDRQQWLDKKLYRRNVYLNPEYIKEKQQLMDEDLLNVYDNLGFTLGKLKTQDVLPAITMMKKAAERAILVLDEAGHYFPKEKYFEILKNKNHEARAEYDRLVEFVRFIRHYINGHLLLTEQDEDNIVIGVRRTGMARIGALRTWVGLTPKGKRKVARKEFLNRFLPAILVGKPIQSIIAKRGIIAKLLTFFKMFLPNYFNPFPYYEKSESIRKRVSKKYTEYKVLLEHGKHQQFLIFDNNKIFKYSTRARRGDYGPQFNSSGWSKKEAQSG